MMRLLSDHTFLRDFRSVFTTCLVAHSVYKFLCDESRLGAAFFSVSYVAILKKVKRNDSSNGRELERERI